MSQKLPSEGLQLVTGNGISPGDSDCYGGSGHSNRAA
jgi:hypothetical protein